MEVILSTVKRHCALVYLDDVFVMSEMPLQHIEQVATVLRMVSSAGLTLKLKKCFIFTDAIDFIGHTICPGTVKVATKKTNAIQSFRLPTTIREPPLFLGLCNVYRQFVSRFSMIAASLSTKLMKAS